MTVVELGPSLLGELAVGVEGRNALYDAVTLTVPEGELLLFWSTILVADVASVGWMRFEVTEIVGTAPVDLGPTLLSSTPAELKDESPPMMLLAMVTSDGQPCSAPPVALLPGVKKMP